MKFTGKIGFYVEDVEVEPGIFETGIVEKSAKGELISYKKTWKDTQSSNDGITFNHTVRVISDYFTQQHYESIRYVVLKGKKIEARSVTFNHPSITIELGGVWKE